jgi:hypothetical protein
MVAAFGHHETVFTVLGQAARKRGPRSLALQLIVSGAIATAILLSAPHWWSIAFLAGWSAAYSAWGLLVRLYEKREKRSLKALLVGIATLGTALAVAGVIGIGLAIYSGDAAGAKNRCGRKSTLPRCTTHPPAVYQRTVP